MWRVKTGPAGRCRVLLACSTSVCLSPKPSLATRFGCKSKVCRFVDLSLGPSAACFKVFAEYQRTYHGSRRRPDLHGHVMACTARLRYVDDQIWISATDCHNCVEKQVRETYPAGVELSATSDSTNRAEWLDVVIKLECDGAWCPLPKPRRRRNLNGPKNRAYRVDDIKCRPMSMTKSLGWVLLRGMVKCRCARLSQMCLLKNVLRERAPE